MRRIFSLRGSRIIWRGLGRGAPVLLRAKIDNADIRIKNNARINYFDLEHGRQLTAKIALGSRGRKQSLAREIKARRILQRIAPDLLLPRIVEYDKRDLRWIIEEYIEAEHRRTEGGGVEIFLRDIAQKLYRPSLRSQPAATWLKRRGIVLSDLHEVLKEFDLIADEDASTPIGNWPVALLHGDLSQGNMIVGKDRNVRLVDWEKFSSGPVVWDLRKLILVAPPSSEQLLLTLSGPEDMTPTRQIRLVLAAELLRRRRTRQESKRHLMSNLGQSACEAEIIVAARERKLSDTLALHFGKKAGAETNL